MHDALIWVKAAIVGITAAATNALGWRAPLLIIWVAVMVLDYISGTMAACQSGEWSSATARRGIWHKSGMILVVTVAAIADGSIGTMAANMDLGIHWPGVLLGLVLAWYILTEIGSVLENAVKMGAPVPAWLIKTLKTAKDAVDKAGSADGEEDKHD